MKSTQRVLKHLRFGGVALAGGKTDKTAVAVVEYYPDQRRVFLRNLRERIRGAEETSADQALHQILTQEEENLHTIAFDAPLQLPKCIRCQLKCPGFERCKVSEIKWMWENHRKLHGVKRPNKIFTPYTERCADQFIASQLEEPFFPSHALGANAAPLAARANYLRRRINIPLIEFFPKLSLWRIGVALKIPKSYLRFHKHSVDGDEARLFILTELMEREIAFIYQQDMRAMVENNHAFESFIGALTAYLKYRGQTELPPKGFPKQELWIDFPKEEIEWF